MNSEIKLQCPECGSGNVEPNDERTALYCADCDQHWNLTDAEIS